MPLYKYQAVGNGLHTDHPIPDLPFVDDSHIPVGNPDQIEAIGRYPGASETWGREDSLGDSGWIAFTTDPLCHDLAWCVRWHPDHGRSVMLYRDEDAASAYTVYAVGERHALLFRAGGYWWDGATWYRPSQVWDGPHEQYHRRKVPAAATVTAAALLAGGGRAESGRIFTVEEIGDGKTLDGRWLDHLALWAQECGSRDSLVDSVVSLSAPELGADQMVTAAEMASIGGIAASTLRAYIARAEADIPLAQADVSGHSVWSRPVAEDWAEQRRRSAEGVTEALSTGDPEDPGPPGVTDIRRMFGRLFRARLWESPSIRKRWALRWRTESAVGELADGLSRDVAASLSRIVPLDLLPDTITHAFIDEFTAGMDTERLSSRDAEDWVYFGIVPSVAALLGWLVRHAPTHAQYAIQGIIGEAERRIQIPPRISERSIKTALSLDGDIDEGTLNDFLARVFTPEADTHNGD